MAEKLGLLDEQPKPKRRLSVYMLCLILQYVVDLSLIVMSVINICNVANELQSTYVMLLLMTLLVNHVQGDFNFLYVLLTTSTFPFSSMKGEEPTWLYNLQIAISIFTFTSTNFKFIVRQFYNSGNSLLQLMGPSFYAKTKQTTTFIKSTNVVLTNLLSALCQATIFYFAVSIDREGHTKVNILILYLGTPAMFLGLFLFSFIYQQLLGQKLNTFFSKKHMKSLSLFVLKQALYFVIIGVACAGIVHGIFVLWDVLRFLYNNSAPEEECPACTSDGNSQMQYPSFNIRNAYDFASTMCSFLLSMGSMFALYVATSEAKLTSLLHFYGNEDKSAF